MPNALRPAVTTPRTVVITGASRGLGLASAVLLYRRGWRVVAAMRSVEDGLERLRTAPGHPTATRAPCRSGST